MQKKASEKKQLNSKLKKLGFLIGNWHTEGKVLGNSVEPEINISGMDTYEWICGGAFILHRVDVFMGNKKTESVEIIGYNKSIKKYFMESFDNETGKSMMHAEFNTPLELLLSGKNMRSKLRFDKKGNHMVAKWEKTEDGKNWTAWMSLNFRK